MKHDLLLRAAARVAYHGLCNWRDQPSFEVAERERTPAYQRAVAVACEDAQLLRDLDCEMRQMPLAL